MGSQVGPGGAGACHHSILSSIHAGVVQGVQGGPGLVPVLHEGGGGVLSALHSSLQGQQLVGVGLKEAPGEVGAGSWQRIGVGWSGERDASVDGEHRVEAAWW